MNISSRGLLVASEAELPARSRLEVTIEWPTVLDGHVPLQLVIMGKVVRRATSAFAVAFVHYEFHTKKTSLQPLIPLWKGAFAQTVAGRLP